MHLLFQILESDVLEQLKTNNVVEHCLEILVRFCKEKCFENSFEPNVPQSVLERRSELEVRAQKRGDVHVSPAPASLRAQPPPTAALVASVADMLHNVSGFAHFPVQHWNERGIYRLLFRCASLSSGSPIDVQRVRAASSRALVAVTSHKCVRASLATTKDCLHNLVHTLTPLQEDDMYQECIEARTQGLLLLASVLAERSAAESLWVQLRDQQMIAFFCCLLQGLEAELTELQLAALYCLSQLAQSAHKNHQDKSKDNSRVQYIDNLKSPYSSSELSARSGAGDRNDQDCQPEYMVEELCKVLMMLYKKIELETMKYQCSQDDIWPRVCSCLCSILAVSPRGRQYSVHRGFPTVLLASLQGVRDHLSVVGKPVETIRNANHNPTMRVLYWLLTLIDACMVECVAAKDSFADGGIATSLNRLWPWCITTDQLRHAVMTLLFNFTNDCHKAWASMCICVGGRSLIGEVCALSAREGALQSRTRSPALLLLCVHTLRHCGTHAQCRTAALKSDILTTLFKTIIRERGRGPATGVAWARLACLLARYPDGSAALLALRSQLGALQPALRALTLPALAHAAVHHRQAVLRAPDLLELLSGTLLAGDTAEIVSAARAVWALAANNHKAKLLLRSAGVAAAVQSALQRLQRTQTDQSSHRALQLLTYTNIVLQAT